MKRVAVLRGGPSAEYDVSMLSGNAVLRALAESNYPHRDITITKSGDWLSEGKKLTQDQALQGIDVVFIALHGAYGEDGQIQRVLERRNIPFTGSRALASGIAFSKELTKHTLRPHKLNMAKHRRVNKTEQSTLKDEVAQIIADLGTEVFVKPLLNRSSPKTGSAKDSESLLQTLEELLDLYDSLLVEEFLTGTQVAVGVLGDYRGDSLYTLPAVEYSNKRDVDSVPGRYSPEIKGELSRIARLAHTEANCLQYSLSNFIVVEGTVYFSSLKSHPDITEDSLFSQAADAIGLDHHDLILHLINTAGN
jgi:D-alanine-D-alanine ligase